MNCSLEYINSEIEKCCKCEICKYITNKVPGEGSGKSGLMFVGEAPGKQEDLTGRPFVGQAGKILTSLIENVLGIKREDVFITSILKCRPPNNRDPKQEEIDNCWPFLKQQIDCLKPKLIVALGRFAAWTLIGERLPMNKLRGKLFKITKVGIPVFVIFHPAAVLYNPSWKSVLDKDFGRLKDLLNNF